MDKFELVSPYKPSGDQPQAIDKLVEGIKKGYRDQTLLGVTGSGKTFTLTRRIVYALSPESGPFVEHLDQVLAITFTKDAAAEIRDRVRRALIEEGMDEEALTVDDAWISTIHGMCSRILRAHALELGIDPEFTVLTDTDELMDQAVEHVLGRATAPDAAPELAASLKALYAWYPMAGEGGTFGAGTTIKGLVRDMLELSSQLPGGMDDVCVARGQADTLALADAYRAALGASKATTEKAQVALDAIDAFEASGKTMEDAARLMMSCGMPRASKAFPKEQVELLKAEAADSFINIVLACGGPALDALMGLARAVEAEYRALKADQSALDNNDLLRMAYEALRDYPAIRAAYEGRFKMVMIDEFQDTDQMQVDLIRYLTGAGERALCTVGDAQQSIYRFRGAEVEVFRRQERKVGSTTASETVATSDAPAGELVKLVRNFRSHDEVLRYVARVFDGDTGGLMQGFLDLEPSDKRKDKLKAKASRRQALFVAGGSTQERTQAKARAIAERFRALADKKQPQIIFLENVANLTEHDNGKTFNRIHNELSERNYYIRYIIADACNYGIPQHRTRTYIVAFKDFDMCNKFQFPKEQPLKKHIFDIIDRSVKADKNFYLPENSAQYQKIKAAMTDENQIYRFSDYGIQKSKDGISFTLKANMGTWYNRVPIIKDNFGIRTITPKECLALQGFPKSFAFPDIPMKSMYKQCGNTVVVPVVKQIVAQLL